MNDDTLILYYYGDGLNDDERASVEAALEKDASVREQYRALRRSLDRFDEPPAGPAPVDRVARWHRSIERAAAREGARDESTRRAWHFPSFAWGVLAAALVAAAGIGLYFRDSAGPVPTIADTRDDTGIDDRSPMPDAAQVSFSRGLQFHLRESREDIMRLSGNGDTDRTMLIMDILRQNQLFEQAAQEHDAQDIARVLRAFEPILLRLASEDISAQDAAALRAKLAFELNVVLTKMERSESDDTDSI